MEQKEISENAEALVVLAETIFAVSATFVLTIEVIPIEIRAPLSGLLYGVAGAIFTYWRKKINMPLQV